jgi:hypothetical protein
MNGLLHLGHAFSLSKVGTAAVAVAAASVGVTKFSATGGCICATLQDIRQHLSYSDSSALQLLLAHQHTAGSLTMLCCRVYHLLTNRCRIWHIFRFPQLEFASAYHRLCGRRVLFGQGFHCTGMPIKAGKTGAPATTAACCMSNAQHSAPAVYAAVCKASSYMLYSMQ